MRPNQTHPRFVGQFLMRSAINPSLAPTKLEARRTSVSETEQGIRERVRSLRESQQPSVQIGERRQEKREAYPYPVYLTPVDKEGMILLDETVVALGKHVSELGFDFYHREPLAFRRVIVSFEVSPNRFSGMLLHLTWCRFGRHGWYDNGGRFLAAVDSPLGGPTYPSLLA